MTEHSKIEIGHEIMKPEKKTDQIVKPDFIKEIEKATGVEFVPTLPPEDGIIEICDSTPESRSWVKIIKKLRGHNGNGEGK